MERKYEILYIVRPDLDEGAGEKVTSEYQQYISDQSGSVINVDNWGSKKFAYEIENFEKGNYVLMTFQFEPENLPELEGRLKLDERVLRYQIVLLEDEKMPAASKAAVS